MKIIPAITEVLMLSGFTYAGVSLRYWLDRFSVSVQAVQPRSPIYPDLLPNLIGCCWMGFIASKKDAYFIQSDLRLVIYVALTSGFAGSLTTFSGWNGYASLAVTHNKMPVSIYLMVLLISFSLSMVALVFGRHLSELIHFIWRRVSGKHKHSKEKEEANSREVQQTGMTEEKNFVYWILCVGSIVCIICTTAWTILAVILKHSRAFWLSLLFGPIGTLIRFQLSKYNPKFPKFPLFTFLVNIVGTGLYAAMFLIFHRKTGSLSFQYFDNPSTAAVDYLIPAITLGFCGSLTTVSTLVNEVYLLKPKHGYIYAFVSVLVAQLLLLVINLPYWKTRN